MLRFVLLAMLIGVWNRGVAKALEPVQQVPGTAVEASQIITVDATVVEPCIVQLPAGFNSQQAYPLVLGLHGYGSTAARFASNWYAFENPQFIYACPCAPYPVLTESLGFSWYLFETGLIDAEERAAVHSAEYVQSVVAILREQYAISEVFLLGFSQGGVLAYQLAGRYGANVAGIACLAAPLDDAGLTARELNSLVPVRVMLAAGTQDEQVPAADVRADRDRLAAAGVAVSYLEFEAGHTFGNDELERIHGWMFTGTI